jgi:streptogramin lyase
MERLKTLMCCAFALLCLCTKAQTGDTLNIEFVRTIPGNFSRFYVDNMGNFYVLSNNSIQIKKLSPRGDTLQVFDNVNQYGNIALMDVSNALKLLVYYRDFSTVLLLDRFLNAVSTIDLRQSGIMQSRTAASSYDGQIWTFDEQTSQIKKLDAQGNVTFTSTDLRTVFTNAPDPDAIIDNDGLLYLYDKTQGWFEFDYYGAFKQQLDYTGWQNVSAVNNVLYGRTGDTLWVYEPRRITAHTFKTSMDIGLQHAKQIFINNGRMYVLTGEGIHVYAIK